MEASRYSSSLVEPSEVSFSIWCPVLVSMLPHERDYLVSIGRAVFINFAMWLNRVRIKVLQYLWCDSIRSHHQVESYDHYC